MLSLRRNTRALCAPLAVAGQIALVCVVTTAHAATTGQLQQQIGVAQSQISSLAGQLSSVSQRLSSLNSSVASLRAQIARIQADLDAKKTELLKLRAELDAARTRLAQLQAFEARGEQVLSQQLVNVYESDRPDIVSVVLEAHGFNDLLERLAFAQRVRNQNVAVVQRVRAARRAVAAQAIRLGALENRQEIITNEVLQQRDALARDQVSLVAQQLSAAQQRRTKASQLASARDRAAGFQRQLARLQAAQAAAAAAAAAQNASRSGGGSTAASSGGSSAGPGQVSSGGSFTFPMPKGAAAPPGTWSLDQGVDISAPGGTPELAVCSGTIVLHGIGGFGPWAPILHCDSPIDGYSYVYYGHAGPGNQLPVGTHVGAGETISEVGPGIVGISTGPHLEIGFADGSGGPIGGGSASTMMSLLQGSYGG